eukprot:GHVU01085786.1.p1 GENE.GHVU01085786.1~~GHVU01085786.1.p1  ORF type:complete len:555 (+),score=89.75 GHVU01085786.1:713-2377(+)
MDASTAARPHGQAGPSGSAAGSPSGGNEDSLIDVESESAAESSVRSVQAYYLSDHTNRTLIEKASLVVYNFLRDVKERHGLGGHGPSNNPRRHQHHREGGGRNHNHHIQQPPPPPSSSGSGSSVSVEVRKKLELYEHEKSYHKHYRILYHRSESSSEAAPGGPHGSAAADAASGGSVGAGNYCARRPSNPSFSSSSSSSSSYIDSVFQRQHFPSPIFPIPASRSRLCFGLSEYVELDGVRRAWREDTELGPSDRVEISYELGNMLLSSLVLAQRALGVSVPAIVTLIPPPTHWRIGEYLHLVHTKHPQVAMRDQQQREQSRNQSHSRVSAPSSFLAPSDSSRLPRGDGPPPAASSTNPSSSSLAAAASPKLLPTPFAVRYEFYCSNEYTMFSIDDLLRVTAGRLGCSKNFLKDRVSFAVGLTFIISTFAKDDTLAAASTAARPEDPVASGSDSLLELEDASSPSSVPAVAEGSTKSRTEASSSSRALTPLSPDSPSCGYAAPCGSHVGGDSSTGGAETPSTTATLRQQQQGGVPVGQQQQQQGTDPLRLLLNCD